MVGGSGMPQLIEITDFDMPELDVYARLSEVQLLRYREPKPGLFLAESPRVIERALDAGYVPVSFLVGKSHVGGEALEKELFRRCPQVPVYTAEDEMLTRLTGFHLTRGMLCAMRRRELPSADEICHGVSRIVVLENIVNPTNIGAVFRSAAALGMDAVLLTADCCDPLYRRSIRVSMGTVFQIPWTILPKKETTAFLIERLSQMGFCTAAMALEEDSVSIADPGLAKEEKLALVLGTEGEGLRSSTIAACDYTVRIPMAHGVDSLNVAAAGAVAFWQLGHHEADR